MICKHEVSGRNMNGYGEECMRDKDERTDNEKRRNKERRR